MGLATLALATVHFMSTAHVSGVQAFQLLATATSTNRASDRRLALGWNLALLLAMLFLAKEILFSIHSE